MTPWAPAVPFSAVSSLERSAPSAAVISLVSLNIAQALHVGDVAQEAAMAFLDQRFDALPELGHLGVAAAVEAHAPPSRGALDAPGDVERVALVVLSVQPHRRGDQPADQG